MKNALTSALIGGLLLSSVSSAALAAEEKSFWDRFDVGQRLTFQYIGEDNVDLGTASEEPDDSFSQQYQLLVKTDIAEDWTSFFHGRLLNIEGDRGFDDEETGRTVSSSAGSFAELRELYVTKANLFGATPLSLQVGRQRIQEPRALWWNSDNDMIRLHYNKTLFNAFVAAGEDMWSYRNNTDSDFREDDEKRFRILGQTSWQYMYEHFLEARVLHENDHSGTLAAGEIENASDRDAEDQALTWAGIRATGRFTPNTPLASSIAYRGEVIGLAGEETIQSSVAGPGFNERTVTGNNTRDVYAWALDTGVTIDPAGRGGTLFNFGYSFGSGDDGNGGTSNEFRQTDMQGNSSRIGLERQQQRNFGEVLRPELSNLHILSAGVAHPVSDAIDVGATYFYYRLDEDATSLRSSGVNASLNGDDKDVGQAVDVFFNVDLDDQFDTLSTYVDDVDFRIVGGAFMPGDAYDPNNGHNVHRIMTELKLRF